ncbi:P22 phage major capsid protein family protein [Saccharomonospora iraqiensis]|uniref:P22 phage major capsid protein family protein n=1 Tax=Saccharomonospora iraqiensis TaxID=52698 RepID=UPI00047C2A3D|nr:P22 phage major capsid protein family protein [Saccharomonospora iraqiensis]
MAVANFIPEIWRAEVLVNFQARTVIANTVAREYEGDARTGNVVNVTEFERPSIVDYATGNDGGSRTIAPQDLTATGQSILIDQEKAFSFYVDDVDRRQAAGGMDVVTRDASAGLAEDAESFLATTMQTSGTDSSPASELTTGNEAFDYVKGLRTTLSSDSVRAPLDGRTLLVNPEFAGLLLGADSKLTDVDTSGSPEGLRNATIGRLLGFNVVETPLLNPGTATCVAYHRSAVGFVSQLNETEAIRAHNSFKDVVRGLHVYGGRVLRPEACLVGVNPAAV